MTADPKTIHIQLDADPRLAAGAGGAVRYIAEFAGLEGNAAVEFQKAAVAVFEASFSRVTPSHPHVDVFVAQLDDRLEVTLSQEGNDACGNRGENGSNSGRTPHGVDEIRYGHEGDASLTRLTKYLKQHS